MTLAYQHNVGVCVGCGETRARHVRVGVPSLCDPCDRAVPQAPCAGCKTRLGRQYPRESAPLCRFCRRDARFKTQHCADCSKPLQRRRRTIKAGKELCTSCGNKYLPKKTCHYCGVENERCTRDLIRGFVHPACGRCIRKHSSLRTCYGCRKHRNVAGTRDDKPFCATCLPTGGPALELCPVCSQRKAHYSRYGCEDCAWEKSHQSLLKQIGPSISSLWARELFERYHREGRARHQAGPWRTYLKRDVAFFRLLDLHFTSADEITSVLILRRLGSENVRFYARAMSFLSHCQLIDIDANPEYELERSLDSARKVIAATVPWIATVVTRFLTALAQRPLPRSANESTTRRIPGRNTVKSAVQSAIHFLQFAERTVGATDLREANQDVLELYLGEDPRRRFAVARFIDYANRREHLFRPLKLPKARAVRVPMSRILPEPARLKAIRQFAAVTAPRDVPWALLSLFALVYAQRGARALRMTLDQIRVEEGGYLIRFAKVWLTLDPAFVPLLERWLAQRRELSVFDTEGASPYLFPGRKSGTHLFARNNRFRIGNLKLDNRTCTATALAALIRDGMTEPKLLSDCFGITTVCASTYASMFAARSAGEATYLAREHARR